MWSGVLKTRKKVFGYSQIGINIYFVDILWFRSLETHREVKGKAQALLWACFPSFTSEEDRSLRLSDDWKLSELLAVEHVTSLVSSVHLTCLVGRPSLGSLADSSSSAWGGFSWTGVSRASRSLPTAEGISRGGISISWFWMEEQISEMMRVGFG